MSNRNGIPTHTTEDGKTAPGPHDPRATISRDVVRDADAAANAHAKTLDHQKNRSTLQPNTAPGDYTPLQDLMLRALRQYGEMHPGTLDGDLVLLMLDFANEIVEEVRAHPYSQMPNLDYYTSATETRPIPDNIVRLGLVYRYALQQHSKKAESYGPQYYKALNATLYARLYGSGRIEMVPWDKRPSLYRPASSSGEGR